MSSLQSRIRALERQGKESVVDDYARRLAVAQRACESGYANAEDYRLVSAEDVLWHRYSLLMAVPVFVAFARAVGDLRDEDVAAVAYPPGETLPSEVSDRLRSATGFLDQVDVPSRGSQAHRRLVGFRYRQATRFFINGGAQAEGLRRQLWTRDVVGDWVLRPLVIKRADLEVVSQADADEADVPVGHELMEYMARETERRSQTNELLHDGRVRYRDYVDRIIAAATVDGKTPTWSKQVRSGH